MELNESGVLEAGNWNARFAVVRAVATIGDRAAAVIDANGDGVDINLEFFRFDNGRWELLSSSGGAGDGGRGSHDGMWAEHDRDADGWHLSVSLGPPDDDSHQIDRWML